MNVAILISILSLIVSATTLYMAQFRKPVVKILLGPEIHIYHPKDGGTALYLPIIITNISSKKGLIQDVYLKIESPTGDFYFLKWWEEATVTHREYQYEHVERYKPIFIDGYSAISKTAWFLWADNQAQELIYKKGEIKFTLLYWVTSEQQFLSNKTEVLIIDEMVEKEMIRRKKINEPLTQVMHFESQKLISMYPKIDNFEQLISKFRPTELD